MDDFQGELSAYLLRAGQLNFSEPYDLPFPADDVKAKFCATTLFHNDVEMLFFGLPDTMWRAHPDQRLELLRKSDQVKEVRKTMALQAKIRGLERFYCAFLTSFTEQYIVLLTEESLVGYVESFHSVYDTAIVEGLYAIEYPKRIA